MNCTLCLISLQVLIVSLLNYHEDPRPLLSVLKDPQTIICEAFIWIGLLILTEHLNVCHSEFVINNIFPMDRKNEPVDWNNNASSIKRSRHKEISYYLTERPKINRTIYSVKCNITDIEFKHKIKQSQVWVNPFPIVEESGV